MDGKQVVELTGKQLVVLTLQLFASIPMYIGKSIRAVKAKYYAARLTDFPGRARFKSRGGTAFLLKNQLKFTPRHGAK